ncbi:MAG: substrate-binding domain-containing protein [Burkholderiales bacterium]
MFEIAFDHVWLAGKGFPRERSRALLRLLNALGHSSSLREAAREAHLSYRSAWGVLGDAARLFGAPLAEMQRGRPARLSPLGLRVLAADERVRAALGEQFERLRAEIPPLLAEALPGVRAHLTMHASHDLALSELARACAPRLRLEIDIHGAEDSLAALSRGECDLAGFHVADALPRAAAAAAALGQWLDPRKHQLVHFVAREQGLIVRPGARIRGVNDLTRPGVRFAGRPPPAGRSAANADLTVAEEVAAGRVDAGFGLRAAAARLRLDFVPLATERYFLAAARRTLRAPPFQSLLQTLRSEQFAAAVARLPGYDPSRAGEHESIAAALSWIERATSPRVRA